MERFARRLIAALMLTIAASIVTFVVGDDIAQGEGSTLLPRCVLDGDGRLVCAEDMLLHRGSKPKYDFEGGNPFVGAYNEIYNINNGLCALTTEGEIVCKYWSGVAWNHPSGKAPVGKNYTSMSAGYSHVCGLNVNGGIICDTYYGDRSGRLGNPPINRYSFVSVSHRFACALTEQGKLVCWGSESEMIDNAPSRGKYAMVSTTLDAACALSTAGKVVCWSRYADSWFETEAPTESNYTRVNVRGFPFCAITKQGGVDCWTADGLLSLADSGYVDAIGTGAGVCAITTDAALECFGSALPPREFLGVPGSVLLPQSASGVETRIDGGAGRSQHRLFVGARLRGPTGGSVSSTASKDSVTLTATPDDGYRFLRWDGDASGTRNPLTITLSDHVFVTAIFEPIDTPGQGPEGQRARLFANRILPEQTWRIGEPLDITMPAASGGSGSYNYSIKYEWNLDQAWTPTGVRFNRLTRRLSGTPSLTLDPNPNLHRFTVFLRAEDRQRKGEWDELAFVVQLTGGQASVSQPPALPPVPEPPSIRTRPAELKSIAARIAARVNPDSGRVEFALVPESDRRILPQVRSIAVNGRANRWLSTTNVLLNEVPLGRISVRRVSNGQMELSFLPANGGERVLPRQRLYRPNVSTDSWRLSSAIQIPIPAACRAAGPVEDGIVFPTRRVLLEAGSTNVYRAIGLQSRQHSVKYIVCADGHTVTNRTWDKVLFTAGYYYATTHDFDDEVPIVVRGLSDAKIGLADYQRGFTKRAWAQLFTTSTKVIYAAIALAHYSPESAADVVAFAVKHVDDSVRELPLAMTLSRLEQLSEEPYEVVGKLAHEHVLRAIEKESWIHLTSQRRQSSEVLVYDSAKLLSDWEYDLARGGVSGAVLSWMTANRQVSAWKAALKTAIPTLLDDALWTLWDINGAINEHGVTSFVGFYERFPPYRTLNRDLRVADKLVDTRHAWLRSRLGISQESLLP